MRPVQICVKTMCDKGEWMWLKSKWAAPLWHQGDVHQPLSTAGQLVHLSYCPLESTGRDIPECSGRKMLLFFTWLICIISWTLILSVVHLPCRMPPGSNGGSGAIHVLMMTSSCSATSRSNPLLSTDAEQIRRAALKKVNSGKNQLCYTAKQQFPRG